MGTHRNYIIGTAGHIDHGKSTLIEALTGTDPDRLPEEKARGMTIDLGFAHLGAADSPFQIECYPHPAIVEIFGLEKRLAYKRGKVTEKREGQITLAKLIRGLERSPVLKLKLKGEAREYTEEDRIRALSGRALKENEDALDSIICVYIAALYQVGVRHKIYGDLESGYIYVPQKKCI